MQSDLFHCRVTLHVSGVTTPIIRSTKNCNRSLRYRSKYRYSYFPPAVTAASGTGHSIGTATSPPTVTAASGTVHSIGTATSPPTVTAASGTGHNIGTATSLQL